jgi:hypothetical protein
MTPAVQRLQFFLSESVWDPEALNGRRLDLLRADPATAPHGGGWDASAAGLCVALALRAG